jgi:uncharacterized protein (TIGR00369 family)
MMAEQNREVAELMKLLPGFVEEQIPFNKVLGLRVESLDMESVSLKIGMKEELIGNPVKGILHGGVISAVLDVTGGITAAMGVLKKMADRPLEEMGKRLLNVGTIDLRIDFLRPGLGTYFLATGSLMRTGQKVAVIRMQLHNDQDRLIAVGTGTYTVG